MLSNECLYYEFLILVKIHKNFNSEILQIYSKHCSCPSNKYLLLTLLYSKKFLRQKILRLQEKQVVDKEVHFKKNPFYKARESYKPSKGLFPRKGKDVAVKLL